MHAITPYLLQSFHRREKNESLLHKLSNVHSKDTLEIIYNFMEKYSAHVYDYPAEKKVYSFKNITLNSKNRTVSAFFVTGQYGVKSDILDKSTGKIRFPKTESDAEVLKHYIQFTIPSNSTDGIALFHKSMGVGIKSLFCAIFLGYFREQTESTLQFKPYSHATAITEWVENAKIKSFNVKGYEGNSDVTNAVNSVAECNIEFSVRPKIRKKGFEATFGKLKDLMGPNPDPKLQQIVAVLNKQGAEVTTTAKLNGATRSFNVGTDSKGTYCDILINEDGAKDVEMIGNQPDFLSIQNWSLFLTNDILKGVHGRQAFQVIVP